MEYFERNVYANVQSNRNLEHIDTCEVLYTHKTKCHA